MSILYPCGGGNPNLRYNKDTQYIQAKDTDGNWINIYTTSALPVPSIYNILADSSLTWSGYYGSKGSTIALESNYAGSATAYIYTTVANSKIFGKKYIYVDGLGQVVSNSGSFGGARYSYHYLQISKDCSTWVTIKSWTTYAAGGTTSGSLTIREYVDVSAYSDYKYLRFLSQNQAEYQNATRLYIYNLKSVSVTS